MGAGLGTLAATGAAAATPVGWGMIAAQAIPELFKLGTAWKQKNMANKYAKTQRPSYEIPQALKDYLGQAKFNASVSGLPGQGQLENKLQRQQASTIARSIQSQGSAAERDMAAAAGDYATKQSLEDTAYDAARFKAAQQQNLYTAEQQMAKQELAKSEYEQRKPYDEAMAATAALTQSANENTMTALEGLMSAAQTAGKAGLFGAGGRAGKTAAGTLGGTEAGGITGRIMPPSTTAAPAATAPATPTAPNWAAGPMLGTDFDPSQMGYSFQDPNSRNYNYSTAQNGMRNTGYNVYNSDTGKTTFTLTDAADASISDIDPFRNSIMQPRGINPGGFPDMQLKPNTPIPEVSGGMNDYGPGAQKAIRRAGGGEVSEFNVNLPGDITNNWANNYFGMEMPTAYGYGNTFNQILNRIGTQYGLGDVYGEELNNNINRAYSRFNPFT